MADFKNNASNTAPLSYAADRGGYAPTPLAVIGSGAAICRTIFATETSRIMPAREIHAPHDLHDDIHCHIRRGLSPFGPNVSFEVDNAEVVLRGVVGSYYQKQMAQESLRRIEGLSRIDNRIQVVIR